MKSSKEFASGLDTEYDGIEILIKENSIRNKWVKEDKHAPPRAHEVIGTLRNEEYTQINKGSCDTAFDDAGIDATMYIRVYKGKMRLSFTDPKTHGEAKEPCFNMELN